MRSRVSVRPRVLQARLSKQMRRGRLPNARPCTPLHFLLRAPSFRLSLQSGDFFILNRDRGWSGWETGARLGGKQGLVWVGNRGWIGWETGARLGRKQGRLGSGTGEKLMN